MCSLPVIEESDGSCEEMSIPPSLARDLVRSSMDAARNTMISVQPPSDSSESDQDIRPHIGTRYRPSFGENRNLKGRENTNQRFNFSHNVSDSESEEFVKVAQGDNYGTQRGNIYSRDNYLKHKDIKGDDKHHQDSSTRETDDIRTLFQQLSWSSKLSYLNTLSTPDLLALADHEAVALVKQNRWDKTTEAPVSYGKALSDVLMTWQQLRSGRFRKDCRVWLWKNSQDPSSPFHNQPFSVEQGFAGFAVRKTRNAPKEDDLSPENYMERMRNYRIECTIYDEVTRLPKVIRLNAKKDQHTERYKGVSRSGDPVVASWDNTGFHHNDCIHMPSQERYVNGHSLSDLNTQERRPLSPPEPTEPRVIRQCASDFSPSHGIQSLTFGDTEETTRPLKRLCSDPTLLKSNTKPEDFTNDQEGKENLHTDQWMNSNRGQYYDNNMYGNLNRNTHSTTNSCSETGSCQCSDCHININLSEIKQQVLSTLSVSRSSSSWSLAAESVRSCSPPVKDLDQEETVFIHMSNSETTEKRDDGLQIEHDEEEVERELERVFFEGEKKESATSDLQDLVSICSERQSIEEQILRRSSTPSDQSPMVTPLSSPTALSLNHSPRISPIPEGTRSISPRPPSPISKPSSQRRSSPMRPPSPYRPTEQLEKRPSSPLPLGSVPPSVTQGSRSSMKASSSKDLSEQKKE